MSKIRILTLTTVLAMVGGIVTLAGSYGCCFPGSSCCDGGSCCVVSK